MVFMNIKIFMVLIKKVMVVAGEELSDCIFFVLFLYNRDPGVSGYIDGY